jgi:hypothetical protein
MALCRTGFSLSVFRAQSRPKPDRLKPVLLKSQMRGGNRVRQGLNAVAVDRRGHWFERGAPAAFAQFIGIDKIIGGLVALRAFQRHWPGYAANAQAPRARLTFHPLAEFQCNVSIGRRVLLRARILRLSEERPGAQQNGQSNCSNNDQWHEDHRSLGFRTGFFTQQFQNTLSDKRRHRVVGAWTPIGYCHFGTADFGWPGAGSPCELDIAATLCRDSGA